MGLGVWGLGRSGLRVYGFKRLGLGFRVWGLGFYLVPLRGRMVHQFRVQGLGPM